MRLFKTAPLLAKAPVAATALALTLGLAPLCGALAAPATALAQSAPALDREGRMPSLSGATRWLNSPPLTRAGLKGKVVLVDFWTYSCINCLRELPYINAWADKYKPYGLVVIGVHAPEFDFEKNIDNIQKAMSRYHITFPVAVDNDLTIWSAFDNHYWPAAYFIDAKGQIRHHTFGEGGYAASERVIQELLTEAGAKNVPTSIVSVDGTGAQQEGDFKDMLSPETYVGYARAQHFAATGGAIQDSAADYVTDTAALGLNDWGLEGNWTVGAEHARLNKPGGQVIFRFHARDLHLVMGPGPDGKPVHFKVTIDGHAPGMQHGSDIDAEGNGTVTGQRLYQLVRQTGPVTNHTFSITFTEPGVQVYSFTFG